MTPAKLTKILRYRAAEWLRYERRCPIICFERPPAAWKDYRPDVMGITRARTLIEIEIKVSVADFRADKQKHRHQVGKIDAHQFYYAVPAAIADTVIAEAETGHGVLIYRPNTGMECSRRSIVRKTKRAPLKWCLRMAENQSGTLVSMAREIAEIPCAPTLT